jgi:hypothetical protein
MYPAPSNKCIAIGKGCGAAPGRNAYSNHNPKNPMKRNHQVIPSEPTEAEIQHAAYLLWIESGRPEGCDREHWLAAREMLCHRHGRDSKTRGPAPEIAAPAPRR